MLSLSGIDEPRAELIKQACTGVDGTITLQDLDKGLSGARVLLAQCLTGEDAGSSAAPPVLTKVSGHSSLTKCDVWGSRC